MPITTYKNTQLPRGGTNYTVCRRQHLTLSNQHTRARKGITNYKSHPPSSSRGKEIPTDNLRPDLLSPSDRASTKAHQKSQKPNTRTNPKIHQSALNHIYL
jgi:hypothetical protein